MFIGWKLYMMTSYHLLMTLLPTGIMRSIPSLAFLSGQL